MLEFGHIDALLHDGHITTGIAIRSRPYKRDKRDLSLRVTPRSGSGESELQHLRRARESGALFPKFYFFGLEMPSLFREQTGETYRHAFVVDTDVLLDALDDGTLDADGPIPSAPESETDNSEAIYIGIDDLRDAGAIVHEVHNADW
jgi:hypothetical protein